MAEIPLSIANVSMPSSRSRARSLCAFLAAVALQIGTLALAAFLPLWAVDALPDPPAPPLRTQRFIRTVPVPRTLQPATVTRSARRLPPREVRFTNRFRAPVQIPDDIGEEAWSEADFLSALADLPWRGAGFPVAEAPAEPAAPPPVEQPVRVGGRIEPPRKLEHVDPVYPEVARRARVEGLVILETLIDREGIVRDVTVIRSHPLLEHAALEAVRRWRYEPPLLNGSPVPVLMTVTIRFQLN